MAPSCPDHGKRELSRLKWDRMHALSTPAGIIAALAMDQRKSLRKMLAAAAGVAPSGVGDSRLAEFKAAITAILTKHASAVLLDPEYGLEAAAGRHQGCGLLMTYESDGFENPRPHRMLELMPCISVRRLSELGADAIKILLSWTPLDDPAANDQKRTMIERIGAECEAEGMPFFLEPVVYDPAGMDLRGIEFARRKPGLVVQTMEEFSKPIYRVDVLKVEFPVNPIFVEGSSVYGGEKAQAREEALDWYCKADSAAKVPYIYLSAGVDNAEFLASLRMAAESGARFSGVLCGRANWKDAAPSYMLRGRDALDRWLAVDGAANMECVNDGLRAATPWTQWYKCAGGNT